MHAITVLTIFLSFLPIFHARQGFASETNNYREIRIENVQIEATLQNWIERAGSHWNKLSTSNHKKIVLWRNQLEEIDLTNEYQALQKLNTMINEDVMYRDDYSHYYIKDYWAEPDVTLEEGGDCEDIALLKAASLLRLKWPAARMQLLVGYLIERGKKESHAVLLVETRTGEQLIMRSTNNQVVTPDRFPFVPLYAVNGEGVFIVKPNK
jgi:predicted transglutaminase-like cysteine proteinase